MKEFDKHEFDEIFRAGLSAPDLNEIDEDWELMKARLQKGRKRTIVPYYLIFLTSVAAVLLLVFSVVFNSDQTAQDQTIVVNKNNEKALPLEVAGSEEKIPEPVTEKLTSEAKEEISPKSPSIYSKTLNSVSEPNKQYLNEGTVQMEGNTFALSGDLSSASTPTNQQVISEPVATETILASANPVNGNNPAGSNSVSITENQKETKEESNPKGSRLSLAINLAPDLNGVEQFQSDKISYSIGAGLIYKISSKLSVEAGAAYGRKSYQTGFSSFRPASYNLFQVKPNAVSSGFDVMDIQLNLDYTLLKRGKSSIGVGAGISSYLMLDEEYSFTYPNIHARGLSSFHTGYQNNHFLGIANLNLSYKRILTNNVKLAINPYLKLPLTDLGYGNIRLRSAGMSIGVITNLNKNKK